MFSSCEKQVFDNWRIIIKYEQRDTIKNQWIDINITLLFQGSRKEAEAKREQEESVLNDLNNKGGEVRFIAVTKEMDW